MDNRYIYKVRPDVNTLADDAPYTIKTAPTIEESLTITAGQYRELRDSIISALQSFYPRTEYKDADFLDPYLLVCGHIGGHTCLHAFHIEEWLTISQEGRFGDAIRKQLDWGKWNYERFSG